MKTINNYLTVLFLSFFVYTAEVAGVRTEDGFVYENDLMKQVLSFQNNMISLESVFNNVSQAEVISASDVPYFEFVINKRTVNARMPVWKFLKYDERSMINGRTEYIFQFDGRGACKGLLLELRKQYFDNSTLTREKLRLKALPGHSCRLSKKDGRLHFIYPQLSVKPGQDV